MFESVDWKQILVPSVPLVETFVRGTIVYLVLFALLRFVSTREAGSVGITDMLVLVLIADAAQNAMAGEYRSVPDGLLLVSVIIFWSYALDWLAYQSPRLRPLIHPPALPLVRNGRLVRQNLRKELITEEELESKLREQGVEDLKSVKVAYMESDGAISVIKRGKR